MAPPMVKLIPNKMARRIPLKLLMETDFQTQMGTLASIFSIPYKINIFRLGSGSLIF